MIVTCPRCLTKFNLPQEKLLPDVKLQLHCSRCAWDFTFSPLSEEEELEAESEVLLAPVVEELDLIDDDSLDLLELERADEGEQGEAASGDSDGEIEAGEDRVGDGTIFELSDDFDSDQETEFGEGLDFQDDESGSEEPEDSDPELDDLALDLDDLNLDDIEFDSFADEPEAGNELEDKSEGRPTQIDDVGELDDFLKSEGELPVEVATAKAEKSRLKEPLTKNSALPPETGQPLKVANNRRNFILVLSCFLVFSLALWAGYGLWQHFSVDMKKHLKLVEVENQRLRLPSDRIVIVLRGKVLNSSPKLVTELKIRGILLDTEGQTVAEVVTAGGVSFSEEELDRLDAGKLAMLENSEATLPANGGELPFMIAFYDYPERAYECYVELSSFKVKKGRWSK